MNAISRDAIEIAPPNIALTFARARIEGAIQLLAVGRYARDEITAFNLTRALGAGAGDPIALFNEKGYDALQLAIAAGLQHSPVNVRTNDLLLPVDLREAHVAVGTNFAEHAEESSVDDGPFLFAKLVKPTPSRAPVSARGRLLDYEVELAFVTLEDASLPGIPRYMGLILANDFTDRATLLHHVNPADVTSGEGFTTGKSAEGFLPVGNLFVIPRDVERFTRDIDLRLAVNGETRQQGAMTLAIWDLPELLRQTLALEGKRWAHAGAEVSLPIAHGALPARTMILAGTPAGTIFNGMPRRVMAAGLLRWLAGGWDKPLARRVIEKYIDASRTKRLYLQPGDEVRIEVDRLGAIITPIVE